MKTAQQTTTANNTDNLIWLSGIDEIGIPIVELECGGEPLLFVLDTGANDNVIEKNTCQRLNAAVIIDKPASLTFFDGHDEPQKGSAILPLQVCGQQASTLFSVIDSANNIFDLETTYGFDVHGLLGTPFIVENNLLIDLKNKVAVYAGKRPEKREPEVFENELVFGDYEFDDIYS